MPTNCVLGAGQARQAWLLFSQLHLLQPWSARVAARVVFSGHRQLCTVDGWAATGVAGC